MAFDKDVIMNRTRAFFSTRGDDKEIWHHLANHKSLGECMRIVELVRMGWSHDELIAPLLEAQKWVEESERGITKWKAQQAMAPSTPQTGGVMVNAGGIQYATSGFFSGPDYDPAKWADNSANATVTVILVINELNNIDIARKMHAECRK